MFGNALTIVAEGGIVLQTNVVDVARSINTVWVLVASFMVFFMQPGFALLEAGQVQVKNVANVTMKNLMDWSLGVLSYFLLGLGVAGLVGGLTSAGGYSLGEAFAYVNDPTAWVGWLFGAVFAMTAATIVSGAVAGRISFRTYVLYALVVTTVVYPVVQGLVWQGGLLSAEGYLGQALGTGYIDFAGGTVVHMVGGVAGLVAAWMVGPRTGRFDDDGSSNPIPGHSAFLAMLGTLVLAFGWYGFNVGTQATILTESGTFNGAALGRVALNTTLAMGAGTVGAAIVTTLIRGDPDPLFTANGMLAGLVAVTAGAGTVTWWGGIAVGAIGGAALLPVHRFVVERLNVDDVCGVFGVHGTSGAMGTLLIPLFPTAPGGGWQPMGATQFLMQLLGILVIAAWTVLATVVAFRAIRLLLGFDLRVDRDDEEAGLDASEHSIMAYPEFATDGGVDVGRETTTGQPAGGDADRATTATADGPAASGGGATGGGPTGGSDTQTVWRGEVVDEGGEETAYVDVESMVESVPGPALVVDGAGTVTAIDEGALSLFGLDRADLLDAPLGFADRLEATVGDVVDEVVGNGTAVVDRTVSPTDWDRTLSVSAAAVTAGDLDGTLVSVRDVTDRVARRQRRDSLADYRDRLLETHERELQRLADGHLDVGDGGDVEAPQASFEATTAAHERFAAMDEALTTVADNVRAIVEQLPDQSTVLANKSESMDHSTREVMSAAERTDELSSEIERDVQHLADQASEASEYVEQQSAAMEEISATANEIRAQSDDATDLTEAAVADVRDAVEEIRAAAEESDAVVSEIDALEARMDDVGHIVDVIQDIAEQTNMLALNASIEAARADQDGDGFAVVADEVKNLAAEARSQASDIDDIVTAVQTQTADVTEKIHGANADVIQSADALGDVVDSLEEARERVAETNQGVAEITDAVERQAETATSITDRIEETSDLAAEIDDKVGTISATADEQSSTLAEVADAADDLSDLAAEVDANVDAFDRSALAGADD